MQWNALNTQNLLACKQVHLRDGTGGQKQVGGDSMSSEALQQKENKQHHILKQGTTNLLNNLWTIIPTYNSVVCTDVTKMSFEVMQQFVFFSFRSIFLFFLKYCGSIESMD